MKPVIGVVIHQPLFDELFSEADKNRLKSLGEVRIVEASKSVPTAEALPLLAGCNIALGSWWTPYPNQELIVACPGLKLWEHAGGSVKHFFGPHMENSDMIIASCAPAIAESVADMAVAELFFGLKRILINAAANRSGKSSRPKNCQDIGTSTVGVIGASEVGRRVIKRLRAIGTNVLVYDPFLSQADAKTMGVIVQNNLVELCKSSHAITLHTPFLPATDKMLKAEHFRAMPDDAVFVNTSRGGCVDEPALVTELQKGRLFAFLDVSDPEPTPDDSPLRRLPNVIYTSHIAGGIDHRIGRQAVNDIEAFIAGRQPERVITADMLERLA